MIEYFKANLKLINLNLNFYLKVCFLVTVLSAGGGGVHNSILYYKFIVVKRNDLIGDLPETSIPMKNVNPWRDQD